MDITNLDDNLLIVCPNNEKKKILSKLDATDKLFNIKFMTLQEYKNNYFYSYDEKALIYLMKKYNYDLDVSKVYLKNLYVIDLNKKYNSSKLTLLQKLKQELIDNNLLTFNKRFKKYINNKKIIVSNYYDLDLYEEEILNYKYQFTNNILNTKVYECNTLEEEVNNTCLIILDLIKKGISLNKIHLVNIDEEYLYIIRKIFSYYNIPINIDMKNSIFSTRVVKDYLENNILDLDNKDKLTINKKLLNVINSLVDIADDSIEYRKILIDKLKNAYISPSKNNNAVNISNLYNEEFLDDEYVFVLGFNQDILPKLYKDIDYIDDNSKKEVLLYETDYLNERTKQITIDVLSKIKNLFLSYKLSSPFNSFYPSSLIEDLKLEVINPVIDNYNNSNKYNKIRLAKDLDLYSLYGTISDNLIKLNSHYNLDYKTYSNSFTGINHDKYLENLAYPLKLSYTSINAYNECQFKYYIKYVLKLDSFTESFQTFIGSLYHEILSLYLKTNFNLEEEINKYLEKRTLSLKEKLLFIKIKKDLISLIAELKKQQLLTSYDEVYCEKKIDIDISTDVSVIFTGTIDKIMFRQNIEDTYYSIVDYKTGTIDTNIEPLKYGLHLQLPVYLYLISYSRIFTSPIFTGSYYQNILFDYPTWSKDLAKIKKEQLLLKGYSTDNIEILEKFDSTYEKSELIKSMSYNEEKGFGTYSKTISDDTLYQLLKYTKRIIEDTRDSILSGKFDINPKVYDGKNIACNFCEFKDLCYMRQDDLVYLDKVEDLSFLEEGDNNA